MDNQPQANESGAELTAGRSLRDCLERMIRRITDDLELRDDLLQEALLHLWQAQARRPNQTQSWYLQSCKFRLQHYLATGRSVDSAKRRRGRMHIDPEAEESEGILDQIDTGASVLGNVSARDIMSILSPLLEGHERLVLECFADGLGPREIGRKLAMSHTMVIKHRRKIAALLRHLEKREARLTSNSAIATPDPHR